MSPQPSVSSGSSAFMAANAQEAMFVTMRLGGQRFGIPVRQVRDVLRGQKVIPIPLAPSEVAGSLNLRGRIVTVIDMRSRLRLPAQSRHMKHMFVVVEHKGELYSLMVDDVGDVLTAPVALIEKVPANLGGEWKEVASGIFKMQDGLLVIVDVATLLNLG